MSSTTRKLSLSFPYSVPKSCPIVVLSIRRTDIKPTKDSNPKTHNQVSKSLATTKTERREIRVLQSCHITTNKQPRSDLVESFHDSCYACTTTTSVSHRFDQSSPLPLFHAATISVLPSVTLWQSHQPPSIRPLEVTHQPCLNPFSFFFFFFKPSSWPDPLL